ncbi:hypothetical protein GUJ93_ZPchr0006g41656 [Zizania palustris]|uniref:Uncharacterized protein n=1 Tax=Zizania palustris TaxID=103762 RepID=A0A8J5SUN4_ZIZPA|nr:hypothetical protein GUJ93_ZPchr0006g41656 [Zizania palustris]
MGTYGPMDEQSTMETDKKQILVEGRIHEQGLTFGLSKVGRLKYFACLWQRPPISPSMTMWALKLLEAVFSGDQLTVGLRRLQPSHRTRESRHNRKQKQIERERETESELHGVRSFLRKVFVHCS